jgi:tetratricopeptide (TPR) repeat protein
MSCMKDVIREAYECGDLDEALRLLKLHLRQHPDEGRAWEMVGLIQHAKRQYSVSVSAIERASSLVPLIAAGRVCLAHGYIQIGRKALACDLLKAMDRDESLGASLLLQVATGLDSLDQPALAMQGARTASQLDPQMGQTFYDMGYYAARCGIPPEYTESLARRAISLDPDNVQFRVGLISHLVRNGRPGDAYPVVSRLSNGQLESLRCARCLQRIADIYEQAGDYRRLILCQQRLLQLEASGVQPDCA